MDPARSLLEEQISALDYILRGSVASINTGDLPGDVTVKWF